MQNPIPISILYLGKRGGGAELTLVLANELKQSARFELRTVGLGRGFELWSRADQSYATEILSSGYTFQTLTKIISFIINPKELLEKLDLQPGDVCLIPMISPLGLIVELILKKNRVNIIRLIHDFEKHPGEYFPPNWLTRKIVRNSSFLITLSETIDKKIADNFPNARTSVYAHPDFGFLGNSVERIIGPEYLLFIGRIRKYKGLINMINAIKTIPYSPLLVIAGEGPLKVKQSEKIQILNKWLTEAEISNLIRNAEVVLFPYIEASQSGLIPHCVNSGKKIVITPLEGLLEQTRNYPNAFISKDLTSSSLAVAIESALNEPIRENANQIKKTKSIETCLLESGLFSKE